MHDLEKALKYSSKQAGNITSWTRASRRELRCMRCSGTGRHGDKLTRRGGEN